MIASMLTAKANAQPQTQPEPASAVSEPPPTEQIKLAPIVQRVLKDPLTTETQRISLQIFHGQWDALPPTDELPLPERANLALLQYDLTNPLFEDVDTPALLRARAAILRGSPQTALEVLADDARVQAVWLRGQAYQQLGQAEAAAAALRPLRERLQQGDPITDAAELTAAARALVLLAQLEGRPARDYQLAMNLLGKARDQLDPLYWPARLAEAQLLFEKDNPSEAGEALLETLALNPQASEAWYLLGKMTASGFDFDRAGAALEKLRAINSEHILADLLEVRIRLIQRDADSALNVIQPAMQRYPSNRELAALYVAVEALRFDDQATRDAREAFERLAPGSPLAAFEAGQYLSLARQYDAAEAMLRQAIARQPNWPSAHVELGLLLMQAGQDEAARAALAQAVRLDPFNRQAGNQLKLVEQLLGYAIIETDHFLIRYKPGIDEVLARDMPGELERIYADITSVFEHQPAAKTQIDIMPDEQWFGVRITGMPDIWTIAASTGDVISLTPPRSGPNQRGPFDWANVIRHEYVHTVTLSKTRNRLPHWFTEACAVWQEYVARDYQTCQLLSWALNNDKLFALDQINWGFIRPKTPRDRPLAYAQANWMLQYITLTHGHAAINRLLHLYAQGISDTQALQQVTGRDAQQFMSEFKTWAAEQVQSWGLDARPASPQLQALLAGSAEQASDDDLQALLESDGQHPELLRLIAQRAAMSDDLHAARLAVLRYSKARPTDPWAPKNLAQIALRAGKPDEAIAALEQLDRQEVYLGDWAYQLAQLHRSAGQLDAAASAIVRALRREPYNATYRELAATIELQRGRMLEALPHLQAMPLLEPGRAIHQKRLAAIYTRLHRPDEAAAAAERARELEQGQP